ncbi:hypothetical protein LV84_03176 [Algoriphagus ratkowskyi]|uniref:CHAD domain-containing protein n=1 Tax=Algoriphagus ratkowskyi TaxID=57028 RepID=A0A2W7SS40_9BACT|nr:hypothetical protein [Algoriphagus ratkowskyi]PZX53452.1 hypothetical protein LV84_03176 [Algoriphagus ratkowskyi]TXD76509.1 hypothetical protein ESW18_16015 [Algoriphagus ratkowskyi]
MQAKVSPVFQLFELQHQEAKAIFLTLGKQIKSKKAIELLGKMEFLELYADLMAKVHFEIEGLNFDIFKDFKDLKRSLRKIHHFKLAEKSLNDRELKLGVKFNGYRIHLDKYKKQLYTEAFDLIVGSTLKSWENFHDKAKNASRGIKPLGINTAVNQIIQEELDFFQLDKKGAMDSKALKDTFEGLRTIIMLENLLIHLGFNSIFISTIHQDIAELKDNLKPWYSNQLSLQSLTHFLRDKPEAGKKYLDWLKELKEHKTSLASQAEKQALLLFEKILG